ncbi:hypothetical protein PACTADRAFT_47435 [Pachysolen tannophilus NRRL Y-2460]|uniref:Knr4/Smi1-like domain-containing protein n=1 Tax=Pachysolen tannophilus NRRL Y-2460 TaxID=669874 RepID=A0A1E4U0L2_PACTA|nr:hypothetical protein PACTADRAFT_47435 [Pachysolen tannophilus NRRL Y-2460]
MSPPSENGEGTFFQNVQHSINSFIYSVTTKDHYASFDSPFRDQRNGRRSNNDNNGNGSHGRLDGLGSPMINNNNNNKNSSTASLANNNSNRSSISNNNNNNPVQYVPGLRSQLQNNVSGDVQLQDYIDGQPPLPSIESIWERLDNFLEREYPELADNLGDSVTAADLNELENDLGVSLPLDVRESYQIHDGQFRGGKPSGCIMGLTLLDLEGISEEANIWKKVSQKLERQVALHQQRLEAQAQLFQPHHAPQHAPAAHASQHLFDETESIGSSSNIKHLPLNKRPIDFMSRQSSVPEGYIQPVYSHSHWIPLAKDFAGNNIAVDLAPGPLGRWGQIIIFGRDFDTKFVVANNWTEFLLDLVEDYEDGKFLIDSLDEDIFYYENGRTANYLDVLARRVLAPLKAANAKKYQQNQNQKRKQFIGKENDNLNLPKETLITPAASSKEQLIPDAKLDTNQGLKINLKIEDEPETEESQVLLTDVDKKNDNNIKESIVSLDDDDDNNDTNISKQDVDTNNTNTQTKKEQEHLKDIELQNEEKRQEELEEQEQEQEQGTDETVKLVSEKLEEVAL